MMPLIQQQQIGFSLFAFLFTFLFFMYPPSISEWSIFIALLLFFSLGISHGALDYALGRHLFRSDKKRFWQIPFLGAYLLAIGLVLFCWFQFPFASFLFFLFISALHFGFSDMTLDRKEGLIYYIEGLARGLLPIATPAYFYPQDFQRLIESSLSIDQAALITAAVTNLMIPCWILFAISITWGFWKRTADSRANNFELISLLVLFTTLKPFVAFILYFCFLHSIRHILSVAEELGLPISFKSIKWVIVQALPTTISTFIVLVVCYFFLRAEQVDPKAMMNLFFVSLAALTFPHMLLVELFKLKTSKHISGSSPLQ